MKPQDSSFERFTGPVHFVNLSTRAEVNSLKRLLDIGFERVGCWKCEGGILQLDASKAGPQRDFLYAFVSGDRVVYIGKSVKRFKTRMGGYSVPGPTQSTNIRIHKLLTTNPATTPVEIYAFRGPTHLCWGEFSINIAAGLEGSLIRSLRPPWNIGEMQG